MTMFHYWFLCDVIYLMQKPNLKGSKKRDFTYSLKNKFDIHRNLDYNMMPSWIVKEVCTPLSYFLLD